MALLLLIWGAVQYFSLQQVKALQLLEEELVDERGINNQRFAQLEEQLEFLREDAPSEKTIQVVEQQVKGKQSNEDQAQRLAGFQQRIEILEQREKALRETDAALIKEQDFLFQAQQQQQPEPVRIRNWLAQLGEEEQEAVQQIYREQLEQVQQSIALDPGALPPNPEEMLATLDKSREELKRSLKEILNQADYQAFLDSLDETTLPMGLPPLGQ